MRSAKLFVVILVMTVLATSAYAFAVTNTTVDSISGSSVSNIVYTFDAVNPSSLTSIAFNIDSPASTVRVSLDGGALQDCESAAPFTHWTCYLTGVTVDNASSLRVVTTR
jgi:hypothetical protein